MAGHGRRRSGPVLHAIDVVDLDRDGLSDVLAATNAGVDLFRGEPRATSVADHRRTRAPPKRGSSEVHVGRLERRPRFLATIEPWHGSEVGVYRRVAPSGPRSARLPRRSARGPSSTTPWTRATPSGSPTSTGTATTRSSPATAARTTRLGLRYDAESLEPDRPRPRSPPRTSAAATSTATARPTSSRAAAAQRRLVSLPPAVSSSGPSSAAIVAGPGSSARPSSARPRPPGDGGVHQVDLDQVLQLSE